MVSAGLLEHILAREGEEVVDGFGAALITSEKQCCHDVHLDLHQVFELLRLLVRRYYNLLVVYIKEAYRCQR